MTKKKALLLLALVLFILFIGFTFIVKSHALDQLDFNIAVRIQDHVSLKFDTIFSYFSLLGSFEPTLILLVILIAIRKKIQSFAVLFLFFLGHVFELIGKVFMHHPGPPFLFFRYDLPVLFPSSYVQPGSSYPSGHSFRAIFLSILGSYIILKTRKTTLTKKKLILPAIWALTIVVLFSRVSLGEHWLTDVVGGTFLGASFGLLSVLFL